MRFPLDRLGNFMHFSNGRSSPERSQSAPYPVYGSNGIIGRANDFNSPEGTTIIGRVGSYCGSLHYSREKCWVTDNAIRAVAVNPSENRYWFYALSNQNLNDLSSGSGQPLINQTSLKAIELPVANPEERGAIGEILGALDDKIELNQRISETLEKMAQAIFKDWFVDFGPVRRKLDGIADPVAIMGGLTSDPVKASELITLFPDNLDDDDFPAGWLERPLSDDFDLTMGQSPPGETYNANGVGLPFFQGRTDFGFRFPEARIFCSNPTRIANQDDTLVSVRAPVGDINMAWERCCIGRGVAAVRHKSNAKSFTFHTLSNLKRKLQSFEHNGTVFGAINKKQFELLPVVNSSPALVTAFEALVGPMDDRIRMGTGENRTLAETRNYLLPKLMSGEVHVRDTERIARDIAQ